VKLPSGEWGMAAHCDIPQRTFEHAIKHIAATEKNLDYIIITGDLEAHDMWEYSQNYTKYRVNYVNTFLKEQFGDVPIYNSIGNHEGVPGMRELMASHNMVEYDQRGPAWLYSTLADSWRTWLPEDTMVDIRYRASYAVRPYPGLKLISINTIYCSHFNFYVYLNITDPDDTLQWLSNHLLESEKKGEKVHLISHIPTGSGYCLRGWAHNFYDLVNRFENTIAGQFYGHTHQDHFQVYFDRGDPTGRVTHVNMVAPSLTTYAYNNPGYRIYTIDGNYKGSSFTVLDWEAYYTNLTEANARGEPEWKLAYKMKEAYNMPDLSPASFNAVIDQMFTNETLFRDYYIYYHRNDQYKMSCIKEASCRKTYACACKTARSYDEKHFCPN
ncbi:unnamed protein product, partial [Mesorhabditis spiculigera]